VITGGGYYFDRELDKYYYSSKDMTTVVVMYIVYCRYRTEVVIVSKENDYSLIIFAFQRYR